MTTAMQFEAPLVVATLLRRRQRFLADVRLDSGRVVVAHTANTGRMLGCAEPGARIALRPLPPAPGRRLCWSWELTRAGRGWIGVNTIRVNALAAEALVAGRIAPLRGWRLVRREAPWDRHTRFDALLERRGRRCWVEAKNVTLRDGRTARFPDAVTERGAKHLRTLRAAVRRGDRAVLLFAVNRPDCDTMGPAWDVDPAYCRLLVRAAARGVELLAYRMRAGLRGMRLGRRVPVVLDDPRTERR
jgi:sugar fermentation stimulation protein A